MLILTCFVSVALEYKNYALLLSYKITLVFVLSKVTQFSFITRDSFLFYVIAKFIKWFGCQW